MTRCYLGEGGGNDYDDNIGDGGHVDDDGHGNGGGDKARLYASLRQFIAVGKVKILPFL